MSNYTMTFYCRDCLAIPEDVRMRQKHLREEVVDKMQTHKLELVDFNLTENYQHYPEYATRGRHKTLVEIKLDLSRADMKTRESIYNRCFIALQQHEVELSEWTQHEEGKIPQSILVFDMKQQAQAS